MKKSLTLLLLLTLSMSCFVAKAQNPNLGWGEEIVISRFPVVAKSQNPGQFIHLALWYELPETYKGGDGFHTKYYSANSYINLPDSWVKEGSSVAYVKKLIEVNFDLFHLQNLKTAQILNGFYKPSNQTDLINKLYLEFDSLQKEINVEQTGGGIPGTLMAFSDSVKQAIAVAQNWKPGPFNYTKVGASFGGGLSSNQLSGDVSDIFKSHLLFTLNGKLSYKKLFTEATLGFGNSYLRQDDYWQIPAFEGLTRNSATLFNHTVGYNLLKDSRFQINPYVGYSILQYKITEPVEPIDTEFSYPDRQMFGYTLGMDIAFSIFDQFDFTERSLFDNPTKKKTSFLLFTGFNYSGYVDEIAGRGMLFTFGLKYHTRWIGYNPFDSLDIF